MSGYEPPPVPRATKPTAYEPRYLERLSGDHDHDALHANEDVHGRYLDVRNTIMYQEDPGLRRPLPLAPLKMPDHPQRVSAWLDESDTYSAPSPVVYRPLPIPTTYPETTSWYNEDYHEHYSRPQDYNPEHYSRSNLPTDHEYRPPSVGNECQHDLSPVYDRRSLDDDSDDAVDPLEYLYKNSSIRHTHGAQSVDVSDLAIASPYMDYYDTQRPIYTASEYEREFDAGSHAPSSTRSSLDYARNTRHDSTEMNVHASAYSPSITPPIVPNPHLPATAANVRSRSYISSTLPLSTLGAPKRHGFLHSHSTMDSKLKALLPELPKGSRLLSSKDYEQCENVWSRSHIFSWILKVHASTVDEFLEYVGGLFTHHIPTLSPSAADKVARDLFSSFCTAKEICHAGVTDNDPISFQDSAGQGILPLFTTKGCYVARCQEDITIYKCYSSRCSRSIPIKYARPEIAKVSDKTDWAQFWGLYPGSMALTTLTKLEIQRQYQIHEVIYTETEYLNTLRTFTDVFHINFKNIENLDPELETLVFGQIPRLIDLSAGQLELSLRERQLSQGPVVQTIGDIFMSWIAQSREVYIAYAGQMCYTDREVSTRKLRDPLVRQWLSKSQADPRTKKLDFRSFHGAPMRRLQRYALLLSEVLRKTSEHAADHAALTKSIFEIKSACQECDAAVHKAKDKIALLDLNEQLGGQFSPPNLGLLDPKRSIYRRGLLEKKSDSLTQWHSRELILLDNFLLLPKIAKDNYSLRMSKPPIPVDYLTIEDCDDILYKSSSSKLIGGTLTRHAGSTIQKDLRESETSLVSPRSPGASSPTKMENLYPLTVKHAGRSDKGDREEQYTFYADSDAARRSWITAVYRAKAIRWANFAEKEPFEIQILSHQAFGSYAHPNGHSKTITDAKYVFDALHAVLTVAPGHAGKHITIARVQCSTMYNCAKEQPSIMLGTDDGVYTANKVGKWSRVLAATKVSQLAILEDFGVLIILADKVLLAYTLDDILADTPGPAMKPPQKLSDGKDVAFFEVGRMKDRLLVIFKRRANGNSVFTVLEPVIGKKHEKASFFKKKGGTDFFRDFDQFYIPAECYGLQYLRSVICIMCAKGFQIMSLDSKQPETIPYLDDKNLVALKSRLEGSRPLGTFRLYEGEFLCCYAECGVFVDKFGSLSRRHTLEWEGRPQQALVVGEYVLAVGREFIEVWDIEARKLMQIITGKDIRILPCSYGGDTVEPEKRVIIAMAHPYKIGQVIFEMKLRVC